MQKKKTTKESLQIKRKRLYTRQITRHHSFSMSEKECFIHRQSHYQMRTQPPSLISEGSHYHASLAHEAPRGRPITTQTLVTTQQAIKAPSMF